MLVPKFTIRGMLLATAAFAVLSLVLAQAVRGEAAAAVAFLVAAGSVTLAFGFYAWAFAAAWACSTLLRAITGADRTPPVSSPFADAGPPKQIITPVDPD